MRIGEVAGQAGVTAKTIRFWEAEGLLPDPPRTGSGYRDYEDGIIERLVFIRQAQAGGLTLGQIRQVLEIRDSGDAPCEHVGRVVADRPATAGGAFPFYGVSMLVAAFRRTGGFEVTAIANAALDHDDQVGCVLFGPIDAAEAARRLAHR